MNREQIDLLEKEWIDEEQYGCAEEWRVQLKFSVQFMYLTLLLVFIRNI